jgi:hypothetical protein
VVDDLVYDSIVGYEGDDLHLSPADRTGEGISLTLPGGLAADIYYIMDSSKKNDEWSRINILATALKYRF